MFFMIIIFFNFLAHLNFFFNFFLNRRSGRDSHPRYKAAKATGLPPGHLGRQVVKQNQFFVRKIVYGKKSLAPDFKTLALATVSKTLRLTLKNSS